MIPQQPFGRTGHASSRVIFGAAAFSNVTQDEADSSLETALAHGINHVDAAASYGEAETRLGSWIKRHGQPFFLATKTGERTAAKAREQIHRSLERLCVSRVDLLQLHCLIEPAEWDVVFSPGGALEALLEARAQGLVRFIGVTGHGLTAPKMHLRSLERFAFDSVLLPYNYLLTQNPDYLADFNALQQICQPRGIALQTIKAIAHGPWGETAQCRSVWYRPLEDQSDIDRAVHWVLARSGIFLNTVGDIHLIPKVIAAAERFTAAPAQETMQAQVARTGMTPLFV